MHKPHPGNQRTGKPFTPLSPLNQPQVHILFPGHFQNQEVIWDATILTLNEYYKQKIECGDIAPEQDIQLQQFIDIKNKTEHGLAIAIGLNVDNIDEPTIFKTMIMIHNYKRLHKGYHAYGQPITFPL